MVGVLDLPLQGSYDGGFGGVNCQCWQIVFLQPRSETN
jgi:hypothetical protein